MKQSDTTKLGQVRINGEIYYKISNVDKMQPFFMSVISDANHWLFIGSNGGLSAGRKDPENALFPYYTDDKIIESAELTGSKTILRVHKDGQLHIWEPFTNHFSNLYKLQRNLYKNVYGNKILFEEVNQDLRLTYRYQWCTSDQFGFVKTCKLINNTKSTVRITLLDGIQNIMPYGVGSALQNQRSNLVDAYKRSELDKESGIGIFALSAIIVDKAEPSEALKASIAWSIGLDNPKHLLSSNQLNAFRGDGEISEETDLKAQKGAYFINTDMTFTSAEEKEWMIIADVCQNTSQIVARAREIKTDDRLFSRVKSDIETGTQNLLKLNAASDGIQLTVDQLKNTRHFANTMFNIMRGGIFDNNYGIEKADLRQSIANANKDIYAKHKIGIDQLPDQFTLSELQGFANTSGDRDLKRLCLEYLPLKFSRRHGDPSRPWNHFSINTVSENDDSKVLDYAGNWRDIFQNWEALVISYPEFVNGMIFKFLNASTFDGYNPYRITKNGIDWEIIEEDDPWSYIGYWGDHQIIYLLKFLEFSEKYQPGKLAGYFNEKVFVYANVPYKIKSYEDILKNPKDTIDFDHKLDHSIRKRWEEIGSDAALLQNQNGDIHHVNFIEKTLAAVLAKISNFIPEAGIWMNTQRPEWNDANNALVGNGVSMVTLYYLRRFLDFLIQSLGKCDVSEVEISVELKEFFGDIQSALVSNQQLLSGAFDNKDRKKVMDALGSAGGKYRIRIYKNSFSNNRKNLSLNELIDFSHLCQKYLEHTIRANKRKDNLYHAYNLITIENGEEVSISYLSEMLEGQVAVVSSGYLTSGEVLETLDALRRSALYRHDQNSYMLYPNKSLAGFLEKNNVPKADVSKSELLKQHVKDGNRSIIEKDVNGNYHFNGNFKNATDLRIALESLAAVDNPINEADKKEVLQIFEKVFNHKAFTGRSGTFFGYEGLGSIYWHMVSKLQLAVQECCLRAVECKENADMVERLLHHYYEINTGIGVHKSPDVYGAFPTDPYSHTPAHKGAQQPGMTGQVKEDIICRFGELGVFIQDGHLSFYPCMLKKSEFLAKDQIFRYVDVRGDSVEIPIEEKSLCFTICQTPVIYRMGDKSFIEVVAKTGKTVIKEGLVLNQSAGESIFKRSGEIDRLVVHLEDSMFR